MTEDIAAFLREKLDEDEAAIKSWLDKKAIAALSMQEITAHTMTTVMPRATSWAPHEYAALTRLQRRVRITRELIAQYEAATGASRDTLVQVLWMLASEWSDTDGLPNYPWTPPAAGEPFATYAAKSAADTPNSPS
jgi:predicted RNA-binding Zn ribbon-like protein